MNFSRARRCLSRTRSCSARCSSRKLRLACACAASHVERDVFAASSFLACSNKVYCHAPIFVSMSTTSPRLSSMYPVMGACTVRDDDNDVGDADGTNDDDDDDGANASAPTAGSLIRERFLNLKPGTSLNMGAYNESLSLASCITLSSMCVQLPLASSGILHAPLLGPHNCCNSNMFAATRLLSVSHL